LQENKGTELLEFSVTDCPLQICGFEGDMLIIGVGFTVSITVAVEVQPAPLVPVTVYVVVVIGLTVTVCPVRFPGIQEKEAAPFAVSVLLCPVQIAGGEAETVTLGRGFTVRITVVVLLQPFPSVPVTVYVAVAVGHTLTFAPLKLPGIHE
jgi:hypothetical protein